jgi:hypothetical protein
MKWTQPDVARTRTLALQPHVLADNLNNVELALQLLGKAHVARSFMEENVSRVAVKIKPGSQAMLAQHIKGCRAVA